MLKLFLQYLTGPQTEATPGIQNSLGTRKSVGGRIRTMLGKRSLV